MQCLNPVTVKDGSGLDVPVPCGKCPTCVKRSASSWSFRLMEEYKVSDSAWFLTLTYNTDHVPISRKGFMNLDSRDLQLFFKRLRKAHGGASYDMHARKIGKMPKPIKYFAVGEYGSETFRPHYHVILFNANVDFVQSAWGLGEVHYGDVNEKSVGYCLKYLMKRGRIPMHKNDDRQPEFGRMSKGLGLSYLSEEKKNII